MAFVSVWLRAVRRRKLAMRPSLGDMAIGCGTCFLDTLGIGSYAQITALFKLRGNPPDELIPGTLNVGNAIAIIFSALLFVEMINVEPVLLTSMVVAAGAGAWVSANYAPSMALLALPGMHPIAAYPIMIASDGMLIPVASVGFVKSGRYANAVAVGLTIGGTLGVLLALPLIKTLSNHLAVMRWVVIAVITYAAVAMLRSVLRDNTYARTNGGTLSMTFTASKRH
jgi:hypothetical protein